MTRSSLIHSIRGAQTADHHGFMLARSRYGSLAQMGTHISNAGVDFYLDCGDVRHGSPEAEYSHGNDNIKALIAMGCKDLVIGNHDTEPGDNHPGDDHFNEMIALSRSDLTLLATNVYPSPPWAQRDKIRTNGGITGAEFGLMHPSTNDTLEHKLSFCANPFRTLKNRIHKVMGQRPIHYLVLATHIGLPMDRVLAQQKWLQAIASEIPVWVAGSHTHNLEVERYGNIVISHPGSYGRNYVVAEWEFGRDRKALRFDVQLFENSADVEPHPQVEKIIAPSLAWLEGLSQEIVAISRYPLVRDYRDVSTNLSEITADAIAVMGRGIGLVNYHCVKAEYPVGQHDEGEKVYRVSRADVMSMVPWAEPLYRIQLTGKEIQNIIRAHYQERPDIILVPSAQMKYQYEDPTKGEEVTIEIDGRPIHENQVYPIVTTGHYLKAILKLAPQLASRLENPERVGELRRALYDYLCRYSATPLNRPPESDGRVLKIERSEPSVYAVVDGRLHTRRQPERAGHRLDAGKIGQHVK